MTQYRAVVGIDYPPNKRAEAGEVISDLPGDAIKWLLEQNLIEAADGKKVAKIEPVEETPVTVIDLTDGISPEEAEAIVAASPEAESIVSEDK